MKFAHEHIAHSFREGGFIPYEDKISFLNHPSSYPGASSVEVRETYMSVVFLTDEYVYKLKKPIKNNVVDFSLLRNRYKNCCVEVRLNQRLAPNIYIGIIPLTLNQNKLELNGKGIVVDWMVQMKRLPSSKMLNNVVPNNRSEEINLKRCIQLLCNFYKCLPPAIVDPHIYIIKLKDDIKTISCSLQAAASLVSKDKIVRLTAAMNDFIDNHTSMFNERVFSGRIIEGHGDLRPEHIYLGNPPAIIDCLEFSRSLRILDTAEELSFLTMECEIIGNRKNGEIVFKTYYTETLDKIPVALIRFYKLKKAILRTYLSIRHITEAQYENEAKWLKKAQNYLDWAGKYSLQLIKMDKQEEEW